MAKKKGFVHGVVSRFLQSRKIDFAVNHAKESIKKTKKKTQVLA